MTNQGDKQASCRALTSKTNLTANEDWMAVADKYGFTGTYNERLLKYLNSFLEASWDVSEWGEVGFAPHDAYTNLSEAEAAFAKANGITGSGSLWSQLGTF